MPPLLRAFLLFLAAPFACCLHALEFRVVSWEGEIAGIYFAAQKAPVEIIAEESVYSNGYTWAEPGPLVLFREVKQDDKTIRVPVATLTPPAGVTHALLVLVATDAARTSYNGLWIDDSPGSRPAQTITFKNLSSRTVALQLGTAEHALKSKGTLTLPTDPDARRVPFKMAAFTDGGWQLIASSSQAVRPQRRTLVLLRDGRPRKDIPQELIDMIILNDRPPAPLPPQTVALR